MGYEELNYLYENWEWSFANGQTDINFKTLKTAFVGIRTPGSAKYVRIISDKAISVRFNTATSPVCSVDAGPEYEREARLFGLTWHDCTSNIFITNASGSAANIKIYLS